MYLFFSASKHIQVRADYDDYNQWGKLFLEFILFLFFMYYLKVESSRYMKFIVKQSEPPHYRSYPESTIHFFSDFWNLLEACLLAVYLASVVQRIILFLDPVRRLPLPWKEQVDLFSRGEQYARAFKLDGTLTLLIMLKTLKYAGLSTRFNLMRLTLVRSYPVLIIYSTIFFTFFMGFVMLAHNIFGSEIYEYSTISLSLRSCLFIALGEMDYEGLKDVNPYWAPVFCISFVIIVSFVLINVFLATTAYVYDELLTVHFERYKEEEMANTKRSRWEQDDSMFSVTLWDLLLTVLPILKDVENKFMKKKKK